MWHSVEKNYLILEATLENYDTELRPSSNLRNGQNLLFP